MTTPASRAGRALARLAHQYLITCQVCGDQAVMRRATARVCRKRSCRQAMDTQRRRTLRQRQKEAQQ